MKKLLIYFVLTLLTTGYAFAQKDAEAKKILSAVSAKYKSYDIVKADFTFTLDDPQANVKDIQTGTLIARSKANKFKVIINSPGDKTTSAEEIISDGKSQWTYQTERTKEVQQLKRCGPYGRR